VEVLPELAAVRLLALVMRTRTARPMRRPEAKPSHEAGNKADWLGWLARTT
jgi:hypothetical protein